MRRASTAAVLALLMSMQAFAAIATCVVLPCCAPVQSPCAAHDQAQTATHHAGHHHAAMHHAEASTVTFHFSSAPACAKSYAGLVTNVPKARMNASPLVSPTTTDLTAPAPVVLAVRACSDPNFSPPILPSGKPLRI